MPNHYTALHHSIISPGIHLKSKDSSVSTIQRDAPATELMTDLSKTTAFSINATASILETQQKMILCGVRLLFVVDQDNKLSGLITATDLHGERPLIYLREHGGDRNAIIVKEIMTPREEIQAIQYPDVVRASIGDIMQTLHEANRQHLLVVDKSFIRGLFSSTEIARCVGEDISVNGRASTFAELNSALVAH